MITSEHDDDDAAAKLKSDCVDDSPSPQRPVVSTGMFNNVCAAVSTSRREVLDAKLIYTSKPQQLSPLPPTVTQSFSSRRILHCRKRCTTMETLLMMLHMQRLVVDEDNNSNLRPPVR